MNRFYTAQEIADRLKIKKTTVYELIKRGELESSKIGKQLRISEEQLERYLNGRISIPAGTPMQIPDFHPESSLLKRDYLLHSSGLIISGQASPALEYLIDQMAVHPRGLPVLHSHLNTYNGLYSLYFKKVHATTAGIRPEQISYLLPGIPVSALFLYEYRLGLFVLRGNPKGVSSLQDLLRTDVLFANREKGSTARMYLDNALKEAEISPLHISGYEKELVSDLSTANSVLKGQADAAIGAESIIFNSKDLDFIPLDTMPMLLVMETSALKSPGFSALTELVRSEEFRTVLKLHGGCDISRTGELLTL